MGQHRNLAPILALILDSLVREMEMARCANDLPHQYRTGYFPGQSFVDPFLVMLFQWIESRISKD